MNKKFSTLMAGLMLASAFSVASAQTAPGSTYEVVSKYETSKTYYLGFNGDSDADEATTVLAVVSNPNASNYGQLILVTPDQLKNISAVKAASWNIVFTEPTDGTAPKFTYINKATGLTLSLDPNDAGNKAMIKGGSSEWLNSVVTNNGASTIPFAQLRSFYEANKAVFMYCENTGRAMSGSDFFGTEEGTVSYYELKVGISSNTSVLTYDKNGDGTADSGCEAINIAPAKPIVLPLNADALNSQLGKLDLSVTSDDQEWFNLYFNQDVTDGAEKNLFAATSLKAVQLYKKDGATTTDPTGATELPYVKLKAKDTDGAYIVVDTAYHTASENVAKMPKFTYAKSTYEGTNNVPRLAESFEFAFAFDPFEEKILIKSHGYYTKTASSTPIYIEGEDGNAAYTYWGYESGSAGAVGTNGNMTVEDAYIRLVSLASVRELTVADGKMKNNSGTEDVVETVNGNYQWTASGNYWADRGMLTNVSMSLNNQTFSPATIADGLYMIKLHTSGYDGQGNKRDEANGDYLIASLAGKFGYAEQAKNQNYDHMPAAQWYVKQNGTSTTSPVSIMNREFFDVVQGGLGIDNIQLFNAGNGRVFFTGTGAFANDTLEFIPVSDASKADSKLGYKYVDEKQASVETYYFNYLSGLALDKGLNTPSTKDSLVRVDETGEKIALRLVPVTKDDSYGIQLDEKKTGIANLVRNAYYIQAYDDVKFAADGRKRYLSYEPSSKKYVMSLVPEMFFLKENNDIDGTHYYALVKAEGYGADVLNPNNRANLNTSLWNSRLLRGSKANVSGLVKDMYPAEYKGMSLIEDATKVWSFVDLATKTKRTIKINDRSVDLYNWLSPEQRDAVKVIFYDKDGEPIIADASEGVDLYAYMPNSNNVITLQRVVTDKAGNGTTSEANKYYAMNPVNNGTTSFQYGIDFKDNELANNKFRGESITSNYAESRISVDDNTLDLFKAQLANETWENELRVSAFETEVNDSPLYRRFNGANGEFGTAENAPLNLKFYRYNNDQEYLFENYSSENKYRDGINDKEISFLGVNNAMQFAENETRSYTMFVDTAYVRENTRMPQYLIGVRPEVVPGDTTWCNATSAHHHETLADSLACDHTVIDAGFTRAMYLFNAQDSVDVKNYDYQGKVAYGAQGYTRLAFKDAVHAQDTLYILKPGVTTEQLKATNLKDGSLFANKIALNNNKHKNVVFQFRLVAEDNNRFLIESESDPEMIAPEKGGWVKIQNGVPVIARFDTFNEAIAQAEIFDVNDEIKYDATANDEIAVEGVSVVAGDGQVTIMGAAGKNVTITNILGKVIASQVIASDNATIAVPAGIVAVAVEGEAAVKAIVK